MTTETKRIPKRPAEKLKNMLAIAEAMSGVLYNMKQDPKVPEGWRKVAERWQADWDAAK